MHQEIKFRKAQGGDADLYFEWANDPVVRESSYNKNPIAYESHVKWFQDKISNPESCLLLFLDESNNPVGQVRIEPTSKSRESIISLSISSAYRGKGFAPKMISAACRYYFDHFDSDTIRANIFLNNKASMESFKKSGFILFKEEVIDNIPSVIYIKKEDN